ncbi:MAG: HAD family hydrolase [Spirochaetaceae bacterium]|jgi:putative hydrolase of the HAD superfamily|nr:HAD family hydrolase [Spirochaetaceae bacterium]
MSRKFDGVAFDLDGTLYPNYRFYLPLIPFIVREHRLLMALGKARDILRSPRQESLQKNPGDTFYDIQARIMGELLRMDRQIVKEKTESLIYRGWEPLFKTIKPYPELRETLQTLRSAGLKLGVLSDFPPEAKLANLNLNGYWDAVLCSERAGALKPDPAPFLELLKKLEISADRLLYVGNSVAYDIIGAKNIGMKAALVSFPFGKYRLKTGNADFVFSNYRALCDYILD